MKRREFVVGTALTAIGSSLVSPLSSLAGLPVKFLTSADITQGGFY